MKQIGIVANTTKPNIKEMVQEIRCYLSTLGAQCVLAPSLAAFIQETTCDTAIENAEVLIVLGGDGTILNNAEWAMHSGVPLIGINVGHTGFLNNIEKNNWRESLLKLVNDEYVSYSHTMLEGIMGGKKYYALNDFLLFKKHFSNTIDVKVDINDVCMARFACDGVLISTPVGSTAYSLSAGGPIVSPKVNAILVTPVCAHTLSARPMLISEKDVITMCIEEGHSPVSMVIVDGANCEENFSIGEILTIKMAEKTVPFVGVNDYNFFELIREKLY